MITPRRIQITVITFLLVSSMYAGVVLWRAGHARTHGFAAYYTAAHLLANNSKEMHNVYDENWFSREVNRRGFFGIYDIFNIQPPAMSLLMLPLSGLSPDAARLLWTLLNASFLLGGLLVLVSALGMPLRWALWLLPLCFLFAPVAENFYYGQAYLFLFALVCLFIWATLRRANAAAGIALGLMAVLKTSGIWLWLLLLLVGGWQILLYAAVTALITATASLPWIGLEAWRRYIELLPMLAIDPRRFATAYQTLASLFGRLFVVDPRWNPEPVIDLPALGWIFPLLILLVGLVFSFRWNRLSASQFEERLLTLAIFLALAVSGTPAAEGYHYTLLLPAVLIAVWFAWRIRMGWQAWLVLALVVLLLGAPLPYRSPVLEDGGWILLAYPRLYGAFMLWGWLIWGLRKWTVLARSGMPSGGKDEVAQAASRL